MSFALPINPFPRYVPTLGDDELERQRRVKRAGENPTPTLDDMTSGEAIARRKRFGFDEPGPAQPVRTEPSIGRPPVIDVSAGSDGVFRRAGEAPPPNTLSLPTSTAPMRAVYEPEGRTLPPPDRQHVDFNQANPMDALAAHRATRGNGNASSDLYSTIAPGQAQHELERVQAAGPQPAHGWERAGLGVLRLLAGDPVGAGEEWIAPKRTAKRRYEHHDLPQAQRNAEIEQEMQARRVGDIGRIANETGRLPSGEMTQAARAGDQRQQEINNQHDIANVLAGRRVTVAEKNSEFNEYYKNERLKDFDKAIANGSHFKFIGKDGNTYVASKSDPSDAVMVTKKDGTSPGTWEEMVEGGKQARAQMAQAGANQRAANAQAGATQRAAMRGAGTGRRTHAQAETEAAAALGADKNGMVDNPAWKDAYDHAYAVFDYEKDDTKRQAAAARQADRTVKAGKRIPANKHPEFHLKVQGLMSGGGGASDPRIGKTFKDKSGKQYRITGIDADGQPVGVPIQ